MAFIQNLAPGITHIGMFFMTAKQRFSGETILFNLTADPQRLVLTACNKFRAQITAAILDKIHFRHF